MKGFSKKSKSLLEEYLKIFEEKLLKLLKVFEEISAEIPGGNTVWIFAWIAGNVPERINNQILEGLSGRVSEIIRRTNFWKNSQDFPRLSKGVLGAIFER